MMPEKQNLVCLFAHYNPLEQIAQYVITYLEELKNNGFKIFFLSNSHVQEEYRRLLLEKVGDCQIFERENIGADFGAWQWAFENNLLPADTDQLLLANDSLFGPIFPLSEVFQNMSTREDLDFWGLTDNYQGGWHLQSYFLLFNRRVFTSPVFKKVFIQNYNSLNKLELIKNCELQLTASLTAAGFKGVAYIPYESIVPGFEKWDARNSTHFFWDLLIKKFRFPFIKKELVLQNPENLQEISKLFPLLKKYTTYPIEYIQQSISDYLTYHQPSTVIGEKISVLCHLYYPGTIYYFLSKLLVLNSPSTQFVFNLSAPLYQDSFFTATLRKYFPGSIVIHAPNQGRDIGGKLAALELLMKCGIQTDYSLIIHDKVSPHTPTGIQWRDKLLKIIAPQQLPKIFTKFRESRQTGVITAEEFVKHEFDPDRGGFRTTSSDNLLAYIAKYGLNISDYSFAAGTIFWIRTEILRKFFEVHTPLDVRKEFEKGNALDFDKGTNIHAWERLFSFVANSQGFKTSGI